MKSDHTHNKIFKLFTYLKLRLRIFDSTFLIFFFLHLTRAKLLTKRKSQVLGNRQQIVFQKKKSTVLIKRGFMNWNFLVVLAPTSLDIVIPLLYLPHLGKKEIRVECSDLRA